MTVPIYYCYTPCRDKQKQNRFAVEEYLNNLVEFDSGPRLSPHIQPMIGIAKPVEDSVTELSPVTAGRNANRVFTL